MRDEADEDRLSGEMAAASFLKPKDSATLCIFAVVSSSVEADALKEISASLQALGQARFRYHTLHHSKCLALRLCGIRIRADYFLRLPRIWSKAHCTSFPFRSSIQTVRTRQLPYSFARAARRCCIPQA